MPFRVFFKSIAKGVNQEDKRLIRSSVRAINLGAKRGRTLASKQIRDEIALKKPYVNKRLTVTRKAASNNLSATITGRSRPTQLIRFATPSTINAMRNKKGKTRRKINKMRASVRVKTGGSIQKLKYFWVPLKNNVEALAYRVPGKTPEGKSKINIVHSVSVDQALKDVKPRIENKIFEIIEKEFNRQMDLA